MNKQVADVVEIPDSDEEDDGPTGSGRTNAPPGGAPLLPVLSRETLGTRSFWKAGNFAVAPTAKFDLAGGSYHCLITLDFRCCCCFGLFGRRWVMNLL